MTMFKEDGSQWYNYFHVRKYNEGVFYIAWNGTKENAFPGLDWKEYGYAKDWITTYGWQKLVDARFEKDVLE